MRTKECARIVRAVERQGGSWFTSANGHLVITGPSGRAVIGSSYGSGRCLANTLSTIRRHAGIDVKI